MRIYDALPDTRRLADDIAGLLATPPEPLAVFHSPSDAVTVLREASSGVQAELFRPAGINPQRPADLAGPDGHFFSGTLHGAWKLRGSGLECPAALGAFERTRATVLDPSDEQLDLACGAAFNESYLSFFVSRLPDQKQDKRYFERVLAKAEAALDRPRRLKDRPTGTSRPVQAERSWIDRAGLRQEIMLMRRGEYVVEVRGTYAREDEAAVTDAVVALIQLATPGVATP